MPFGNESAWDLPEQTKDYIIAYSSPMPFGNESAWDRLMAREPVLLCLRSPMPFGNESAWDFKHMKEILASIVVTNAFRQ